MGGRDGSVAVSGGEVSGCTLNIETVPSAAPARICAVTDGAETDLIRPSSPVACIPMISPPRLSMEMPPSASTSLDPSPDIDTSAIARGIEDFQRSRPFRFRRYTVRPVDAAAIVEPSREVAT